MSQLDIERHEPTVLPARLAFPSPRTDVFLALIEPLAPDASDTTKRHRAESLYDLLQQFNDQQNLIFGVIAEILGYIHTNLLYSYINATYHTQFKSWRDIAAHLNMDVRKAEIAVTLYQQAKPLYDQIGLDTTDLFANPKLTEANAQRMISSIRLLQTEDDGGFPDFADDERDELADDLQALAEGRKKDLPRLVSGIDEPRRSAHVDAGRVTVQLAVTDIRRNAHGELVAYVSGALPIRAVNAWISNNVTFTPFLQGRESTPRELGERMDTINKRDQ